MAPYTRAQAFEQLRASLELTLPQEHVIAARQKEIREALAEELTVEADFLTGSYRRRTLISPLERADIDVVVVLNKTYRARGPRAVLDLVRTTLAERYPNASVSRNGQAVTIALADVLVDVVPAFQRDWLSRTLGNPGVWDICDSGRNAWIPTNPKRHVDLSAEYNEAHNGQLIPRIKQLKQWNRVAGEPLRSFHIEVLAWSIFGKGMWDRQDCTSDWGAARYFFDKAREKVGGVQKDPATGSQNIGDYLSGLRLREAVDVISVAHARCVAAETVAAVGDLEVMHDIYGHVFGSYYPGGRP